MFPNFRLMIAAIAASILGISCGLGMFATFSINHDPFARPPASAPPMQLVLSYAAPGPASDATAPFGVRMPANPAGTSGAELAAPPASAPLSPSTSAEPASALGEIAAVPADEPSKNASSADQAAAPSPTSDAGSPGPENSAAPPRQTDSVAVAVPADESAPGAPPAQASSPPQINPPSPTENKDTPAHAKPAADKSAPGKPAAKTAHKPAQPETKVAKAKVVRRVQTTYTALTPAQNYSTATTGFQSFPQAAGVLPAQGVRRRVVVKHHRPVTKAEEGAGQQTALVNADSGSGPSQ